MLGVFLAKRARHYQDTRDLDRADSSYALARVLFPAYRDACVRSAVPFLWRASQLFNPGEIGHPDSIFDGLAPTLSPAVYHTHVAREGLSIHSMSRIESSEQTISV